MQTLCRGLLACAAFMACVSSAAGSAYSGSSSLNLRQGRAGTVLQGQHVMKGARTLALRGGAPVDEVRWVYAFECVRACGRAGVRACVRACPLLRCWPLRVPMCDISHSSGLLCVPYRLMCSCLPPVTLKLTRSKSLSLSGCSPPFLCS